MSANYVTGDTLTADQRAKIMDRPTAPPQAGGWSQPYVSHDVNLSWQVATRRGSIILKVGRLTQEEVERFDANKELGKRVR